MTKLIKGGTVVTHDRTFKADVFVQHDKIVAVGADLAHDADHTIDASGCYVMPGGIDPHTHMEMPFMGTHSSDDFDTGTAAALSGGTTMIVDFCLPSPGEGLLDTLQQWHQKAGKARTDYSFHMAITWWGEQVFNEMPEVVNRGINTFKHFMAYKGALMVNDDEMYASFQRLAELGAIAMVHAENGDVVAELSAKLLADGNTGPEAHAYSRPPQVEGEATNRAIMIADMRGVNLQDHKTTRVQSLSVRPNDLLIAMEPWQLDYLKNEFKDNSCTLLGLWGKPINPHIHDPYGASEEYFNRCFCYIEKSIDEITKKISKAS